MKQRKLDELIDCEVDGNSRWCDADEVYEMVEQLEEGFEKHDRECAAQDKRKDEETERLRKEKEWLLIGYIDRYGDYVRYRKGDREVILKLMQQALKEDK
ncbi:unnamed protein product [marine sediment metagenome]|uniref:Uncharacterized protein n=1 Tax=marine sediment metagenome TaxID=412755 RepID=X1DA95_9ZZZZ